MQSERKVQELLSQLAVEERQCLDLVKLVKDLILHEQEALQAQRRSSAIFKVSLVHLSSFMWPEKETHFLSPCLVLLLVQGCKPLVPIYS
jgi:hypothetical protein